MRDAALMQREPEPAVVAWLDRVPTVSVWTTTVSVFEVRFGLATLPDCRRRQALQDAFEEALGGVSRRSACR